MLEHTANKTIWQSYVWYEDKCFFVSTIERNFDTYEGTMRGMETLVWEYDFETRKRGKIIYQAGGVHDHQSVCRCLIAIGMVHYGWEKEELMTGNEDLTVQFGEDPPWDDLPPVDREKANKELESRLIFDSWTCRFCGGTFADRTLAIKHAIDCDDNEDVHSCATCASYEIGEDTRDGYRHICKGNPKRIDTWMKHCPEWIGA